MKVALSFLLLALVGAFEARAQARPAPEPMFLLEEEEDFAGAGDFLCQEAIGLKFLLPPPGFKVNEEAQEKLVFNLRAPGPSAFGWVWLNEEKGQLIVLEMVKGPATAQDFLFFAGKVEQEFGRATGFKIESKEEKVAKAPFRYLLSAKVAEERAFDIECVSTPPGHRDPAVACMVTFAETHDVLQKLRASLTYGGCR